MRLGVVAALRTELAPTLRALRPTPAPPDRPVPRGSVHAPPYVFRIAGIGVERAAAAALDLARGAHPDALLSVGFCGAVTGDLDTGDLLLGGTTRFEASADLEARARAAWPKAKTGRIATVKRVLVDAAEKSEVARASGAAAVDMEADAVGRVAREHGIGFLCAKTVIDTPSEPLASTYAGVLRVLWDLLRRPGAIGQMIYDSRRVSIGADRLRDFFVALREADPAGG